MKHITNARLGLALSVVVLLGSAALADSTAGQVLSGSALKAVVNQSREEMMRSFKSSGVIGAIGLAKSCYAKLNPQSSAAERTHCIALDFTGITLENAPTNEFRAVDLQTNDYFSGEKYQARMDKYLPPLAAKAGSPEKMKSFKSIVTAFKTP